MSYENTLIILGAGASKAMDSNIPTMADFFRRCTEMAREHADDTITLALALCDYERCFEYPNAAALAP